MPQPIAIHFGNAQYDWTALILPAKDYDRYMKLQGGVGGGGDPLIAIGTRVGDGEEEGGEGELDETLEDGEGDSSALGPANSRFDCPPPVIARLLPVVVALWRLRAGRPKLLWRPPPSSLVSQR